MNSGISLAGAFWGIGVLGGIAALVISMITSSALRQTEIAILIITAWVITATVFIWKAGRNYYGRKIWVFLSRSSIILFGTALLYVIGVTYWLFRPDPGLDSSNITAKIERFTSHPYIGFWKVQCSDNFGFAIEKASERTYYIRFCGPGGCFRKSIVNETPLINDPRYKIVDDNTILVDMQKTPDTQSDPASSPQAGGQFKHTLVRCS